MQKVNFDSYLSLYTKIHLKWVIDANVKPKIIKLLEENLKKHIVTLCYTKIPELWHQKQGAQNKTLIKGDFIQMEKAQLCKRHC